MSISKEGLKANPRCGKVSVSVNTDHPLIKLATALCFESLYQVIEEDLKRTTVSGFWWLGRKLKVKIHLGAFILQSLFKETDRNIERRIKDTPVLQIFCGQGVISNWHCPDHTKIEKFRNRLSPETQKKVCEYVIQRAVGLGFADPSWMDIDSTVQEANMTYPSDARLMRQLADKCYKVVGYMQESGKKYLPEGLSIDLKKIAKKSKEYFFLAKNTCIEKKRRVFAEYHQVVKKELKPAIEFMESLSPQALCHLPWNIQKASGVVADKGRRYLLDVAHFIRTHSIKQGKILSWHAEEVACIKKGKVNKDNEFGRVFQLGRIGGNYMIPFASHDLQMNDKESLIACLKEHGEIFGSGVLKEVGTDKGYYSQTNIKQGEDNSINMDGVQRPAHIKTRPAGDHVEKLRDRRAGIEPLIGHVKHCGLGKSKMKSDTATLASGYRSALGFNLNKLMGDLAKT